MFDHSIKVPRLYKTASKIAKLVSESRGSVKQLVYENKHYNIKALYALVVETLQRTKQIDNLLKKSKLLENEPRIDSWLARILITELVWGKKCLPGQSKPIQTILAYEQIFKAHISDFYDISQTNKQVDKPRYVRINTLKATLSEALDAFCDEGWTLVRHQANPTYESFLQTIANLKPHEFTTDIHIPYLFIFPPKTQFYNHSAYRNGTIILQDKASCLPVHILNPGENGVVLDMCAAPGMKTTQLAALIGDKGVVYAVELDRNRFETLNKIVESSGANCVQFINRDVLTITENDCKNVEYILVDPSCSGSGISDRLDLNNEKDDPFRLEKLAGFQTRILRHALTNFPSVKRVVYSTCSIYPEENEDVVRQVLETCPDFKLVPAQKFIDNKWLNYGSSDFGGIGELCIYAKTDIDLTNGFFISVFERLQQGERNQFLNTNLIRLQKKFNRERRHLEGFNEHQYTETEDNQETIDKEELQQFQNSEENNTLKVIKKKKKHNIEQVNEEIRQDETEQKHKDTIQKKEPKHVLGESEVKGKKRKRDIEESSLKKCKDVSEENKVREKTIESNLESPVKKRKSKKYNLEQNNENTNDFEPKKKSRKTKNSQMGEVEVEIVKTAETISGESKVKEKKRKKDIEENSVKRYKDISEENKVREKTIKSKVEGLVKKKKSKKFNLEQNIDNANHFEPKKKSRKTKNCEMEEVEVEIMKTEETDDFLLNKKKKKHRKIEEIFEEISKTKPTDYKSQNSHKKKDGSDNLNKETISKRKQ